jgi:phage gpG-like protein
MSKKFDEKQFDVLQKKLLSLTDDIKKEVQQLSSLFIQDLKKKASMERDPYEDKWKERKDDLPHPILNKTGRLQKSYKQLQTSKGLTLSNTSNYASYHQEAKKNALRLILPTKNKGLPQSWRLLIQKRIKMLIKQKFG